ncbi:MAG: exodeoxyribonuclease V subunit gamma [Pseudohongiella sp.]|nr:exodeoxyribonuclease V subunit gamma [Pseudohongiella sp.]
MIQPGFMVLQSNRLENLRRVTVEWLRRYPLQPLENEILLVQSNGISQWLKLALAADINTPDPMDAGCGIAAAMDISLPGRFHWRAYRAVLGDLPETSPFDKPLLSWRLLRLLPSLLDDAEFAALKHFLADDKGQRKQFQLAQRLADLLDQYQIYRADWLNDWAAEINKLTRHNQRADLPEEQSWQAALWRRLLQDIPEEARSSGRAQIHQQFLDACQNLDAENRPKDLPRRVVVFGLSSLPGQTLEVLAAISRCTQVVLCVHNPSMHYWGDIVDPQQSLSLFRKPYKRQPARSDFPALNAGASAAQLDELFIRGNPLLAAWGKQGRDYIRLLDEHDERSAYESLFQSEHIKIDLFEDPDEGCLLGQLQGDIFYLRSGGEARQYASECGATADGSISFHIAHSAQREVEILQDHLLTLFNNSPDLRPRDVLVMVPDINQFAPAVQAVFGRLAREDNRYIPFTISDQGKRHQAPVLLALGMLLQLPSSRLGVSELLDFLDVPAVQKAFEISADDKPLLHRWIEQAGIRWGISASHRQSLGMSADLNAQALEQNTWHFGLRRMLLGYANGRGEQGRGSQWQNIEAFDEVGGLSAALVGKLAHLLRQLEHTWTLFREPAPVAEWTLRLSSLLAQFFVAADDNDLLLITRIEKMLRDWRDACTQAQFDDALSIDVVREFILEQLDVQPLTQRFLAGSVNFATLMPMRAIPFKHICLLGMNDGDYPRQVPSVDFDLMRHDYRPGDRSRRDDDRYLFLEALLSARDSLYISWAGRSIRDNSERPPSVLVAQLRDYLADTHGKAMLTDITREYPLQPFSRRYFDPASDFYTYASEWTPALLATSPARSAPHMGNKTQINEINLNDLEKLLRVPANVFFEQSLGVNFSIEDVTTEDHETFSIDALARWKIQQQLIREAISGLKDAESTEALLLELMDKQLRSGNLPIPPFADLYVRQTVQRLIKPLEQYRDLLTSHTENIRLSVTLESDNKLVTLQDHISDVWQRSVSCDTTDNPGAPVQRIRCVLLSSQLWSGKDGKNARVKWHYLARLWPVHLAAQLSGPVSTHIFGPDTREVLAPLDRAEAEAILTSLINLWQKNLQSPLAACVKTSCAMLTTPDDRSPDLVARDAYHGGYMSTGEVEEHYTLFRLWPQFDALNQGDFTDDSYQLYGALTEHWLRHRNRAATGDVT